MFRRRLRRAYTDKELLTLYSKPHNSDQWPDHEVRVDATVALGRHAAIPHEGYIVDLSCGNGRIPIRLADMSGATPILGDFAPSSTAYDFVGPIEQNIEKLGVRASLFVCSETIEHLDDPDSVLAKIRKNADQLLLSTPIRENDDRNPEHYWGWDQAAVGQMLRNAGWKPVMRNDLLFYDPNVWYDYQIWLCR